MFAMLQLRYRQPPQNIIYIYICTYIYIYKNVHAHYTRIFNFLALLLYLQPLVHMGDDGRLEAQFKMKELESEQRRNETVQMAQNVERLKVPARASAVYVASLCESASCT